MKETENEGRKQGDTDKGRVARKKGGREERGKVGTRKEIKEGGTVTKKIMDG